MKIKYKLINKETGEVFVNVRGYMLHENGDVESIILEDGTPITTENIQFRQFMEVIDGYDVYDGDKALVELTERVYDSDEGEYSEGDIFTVKGTFRELYEEGLYYLVDDVTDEVITYNMLKPKIISIQ